MEQPPVTVAVIATSQAFRIDDKRALTTVLRG
jgi:hypothetical protein